MESRPSQARGQFPKRGVLALGCIATALMGIVGCTTVTNGTATPDTKVAPAYRQSVSSSVSASIATSSVRESQRQQSLTTKAVRSSCDSLATTSKEAIDKVNAYVGAFNGAAAPGRSRARPSTRSTTAPRRWATTSTMRCHRS